MSGKEERRVIVSANREAHGGNLRMLSGESGLAPARILDFSANINPLGPVPALARVLCKAFGEVVHYPDPDNVELVSAIHRRFGWQAERIVVGNGASELLHGLCRSLGCRRAVIPVPSYSDYAAAAESAGMRVVPVAMDERDGFRVPWARMHALLRDRDLVILGTPNNPTGQLVDVRALRRFAKQHPAVQFIVDESFIEFVSGAKSIADALPANVVMLRSMTKFYAIPGLRLGFVVAHPPVALALRRQLMPWSVNCMASRAGIASLANNLYARKTRVAVERFRVSLMAELRRCRGLTVFEGAANFLLVRLDTPYLNADALRVRLLGEGIAVRACSNFEGLDPQYFRVAVRTPVENRRLGKVLRMVLED